MKKKRFRGVLAAILLVFGLVISGCSTAFWEGFDAGYNATRDLSSDYIFDK